MRLDLTGIDPLDHALARRCSVGDIPTRAAATFSGRTAVTDDTGSWTFTEVESFSNRLAHGLTGLGLEPEEPVALLSTNCREFVATYFGAAKAGMVALPVNLLSGPENIAHALSDSGTRILVVHAALAELALGAVSAIPAIRFVVVIGSLPHDLTTAPDGPTVMTWDDLLSPTDTNPDTVIGDRQVVQCLYSSGTTSRPKGVLRECTPATVMQWPELNPDKSDSWGYPSPIAENRIAEPGGAELVPTGEEGEIVYRGPTVMEGYWNNPDANAEAFTGGHLHSGDLGHLDADGVLWFSDRVKDIVKSGGENVSSMHVERVLMDHPHLAEVACIGRPDPTWGEQVVAVVVAAPDAPAEEELVESVLRFGAERLTASQRPRHVMVVDAIPRTATGKIRKVELRSMG